MREVMRCAFCGAGDAGTSHKCPDALAHLEKATRVVELAEEVAWRARLALRRFTFARHDAGRQALELVRGLVSGDLLLAVAELEQATPPSPSLAMPRAMRGELAKRELAKHAPPIVEHSLNVLEDRARLLGYANLAAAARDGLELLERVAANKRDPQRAVAAAKAAAHRYAPSTSDAVLARREAVTPATPSVDELEAPAARPMQPDVVRSTVHVSVPKEARPVVKPSPVPARNHDAMQFIEEDPVLGNMPAMKAWEQLVARLEKLEPEEVLVRCNLGHSWVARDVDGEGQVEPNACPGVDGAPCQAPAPVLAMGRKSIATIRRIAALPAGHRLGRCAEGHEWDADDSQATVDDDRGVVWRFDELRAADGRPVCPACGKVAELCFAGVPV